MKKLSKYTVILFTIAITATAWAGMRDRSSDIELYGEKSSPGNYINIPELLTAPGTPKSGTGNVYCTGNDIYFKSDAGVATSMIGAASGGISNLDEAYDGGGAGSGATIDADSGPVIINGSGADIGLQAKHSGSGNTIDIINAGTGKDIDGTSSTWSVTKLGAAVFATVGAHNIIGDVNIDDGVTDSPALTFIDATNETAAFVKTDAGVLGLTTDATDGLNILVGNLWVGNGTPGVAAMDGEDAYVEGALEVDGACEFDGAVNIDGALSVDAVITLTNSLTIDNEVNNVLEWNENSEEIKWTFNSNDLAIVSTTDVVELSFFDNAADAKLTHAADGANDDFYISQTGAQDASLVINSEGTGADALQITTSAGGIDITNGGAAEGEDLDIDAVLASLNLNADEAVADAVTIAASAGGVDITSAATFDIDITATLGTVKVIASEAAADQFKVDAQGEIDGDAINLETTNGGIMLNADGAEYGDIEVNAADDIILTAAGDTSVTGPTFSGDGATAQAGFVAPTVDGGASVNIEIADSGKVYYNSEAGTFNLPAVGEGLKYTFVVAHASVLTIEPDGTDRILILTDTNGDSITSSTPGDTVTLVGIGSIWYTVGVFPASTDWADGN